VRSLRGGAALRAHVDVGVEPHYLLHLGRLQVRVRELRGAAACGATR
jgi:hypothetical protein